MEELLKKYGDKGFVWSGDTCAIIVDSGPDWGPDEWRVVKYCGRFSEERIRECLNMLLQKLRIKCEEISSRIKEIGEHVGPVESVMCDWADKRDCFDRVELLLWSMGDDMLELNVTITARPVMNTKSRGWGGIREHWLGRMNKKEMLEWIDSEVIVEECTEMISDILREHYIE